MAFSRKLTDSIKETTEIAKADGADILIFTLKNMGRDAVSAMSYDEDAFLFCAIATILQHMEDTSGTTRKQALKLIDKTLKHSKVVRKDFEE